mgnify:CR=1 FL=1
MITLMNMLPPDAFSGPLSAGVHPPTPPAVSSAPRAPAPAAAWPSPARARSCPPCPACSPGRPTQPRRGKC